MSDRDILGHITYVRDSEPIIASVISEDSKIDSYEGMTPVSRRQRISSGQLEEYAGNNVDPELLQNEEDENPITESESVRIGVDDTRIERSGKNALWRETDVVLKTKNAIFDVNAKSKLQKTLKPLLNEFVKARYFADTKDEALKKVQNEDLGKSASEFLVASEFLHFLKDKKRWDIVGQIERTSSTVKSLEKAEAKKPNSLDLKVNRRRIESHLDPRTIEYVDRFITVFGSGDVTKVSVDIKRGAVSVIKLFYNTIDGVKSVFLTKEVIHNAIDGINYYRDSRNSDPTGLSVIDNRGDMLVLTPNSTSKDAKEFLSQISINNEKLSGDYEVVVNKS